ncbi:type IV pilin protein [Arenimonas daejeonensis]|uniref:type IV pilin protein n=1 Tax=Arenimonas daejeonensis TaxID=370777 RepID=UPI0011BF2332|nr:type IV pilin protein [Arenimonas daejeonensis]
MSKIRGKTKGFTLIELMIVVAILGILAAIAYASYQNSVINSRRAAASACLMEMAQYMERAYTTNITYVLSVQQQGAISSLSCQADLGIFYTFSPGVPTASAYTLVATAQGPQLKDTKCGNLSLNQAGTRLVSGTATPAECW